MRKSGRQRWQRSQRIPGFGRKISETTGYSEIDRAYSPGNLDETDAHMFFLITFLLYTLARSDI